MGTEHPRGDICIREGTYASAWGHMHPRGDVCIRVGVYASARGRLVFHGHRSFGLGFSGQQARMGVEK